MTENRKNALDLIAESIQTVQPEFRTRAKKLNCEQELDELKQDLLRYLHVIRCSYLNNTNQ